MTPEDESARIIVIGTWGRVECAVRSNESIPALEYLRELGTQAKGFLALFHRIANGEQIRDKSQFEKEQGDIWAFKKLINNQMIRFPCFQRQKRWILTHGVRKRRQKWRREDFDKAMQIRGEHIQWELNQNGSGTSLGLWNP